ncbi:hypothetical protein CO666_03890 [Rhizobium chutanense]|uniref:Uncharacterized protein n=1 Tax=Rhizobium chutanense TaxID=2035448 RepID=A0A2A6JIC9_9HYPH|nr:hypothetical protein CO666_03890 [Rhizobium chutanense]
MRVAELFTRREDRQPRICIERGTNRQSLFFIPDAIFPSGIDDIVYHSQLHVRPDVTIFLQLRYPIAVAPAIMHVFVCTVDGIAGFILPIECLQIRRATIFRAVSGCDLDQS